MRPLAVVLLGLTLVAPGAAGAWTSFHGDDRNTGSPNNADYEVYTDIWWTVQTEEPEKGGARPPIEASPVVADDRVIVADWGGLVRALDANSGTEIWRGKMSDKVVSTPAIAGGRVYVADVRGQLIAFDLERGTELAKAQVGATLAPITIHQGKLFIGNDAGEMKAYDTQTLTLLWTFKLSSIRPEYTVSEAGAVSCKGTAFSGQIRTAAAVYDGKVFFGALNNYVFAVNEEGEPDKTTKIQWIHQTDDIVWSSPAVDTSRNRVVFGSYDGTLRNFLATPLSGGLNQCFGLRHNPSWTFTVPDDDGPTKIHASPAIAGDLTVVGSNNGNIYGVNSQTGLLNWWHRTGDSVTSSPAIANGIVIAGSDDGKMYWINATDGMLLKTFDTGAPIKASPAIDGKRAYVATFDGTLYLFGPKPPARPDLKVTGVDVDDSGYTITVQNAGQAMSERTILRVLRDGDLLADLDVPELAAGELWDLRYDVGVVPGLYAMNMRIDPDGNITEEDESNNELDQEVNLEPPSEEPEPAPASDEESPGLGLAVLLALLGAVAYTRRRK